MPRNDFSKILLAAVEEGLSSLGDSPKQAIFFHLETSFKIKKEHIPENLTEFTKALDRIFGPGAPYLEKLIVKRLCEKMGVECKEADSAQDFLETVNKVQKRLMPKGECLTQ